MRQSSVLAVFISARALASCAGTAIPILDRLHANKIFECSDNFHAAQASLRIKRARSRQCPVISGIGTFDCACDRRFSRLAVQLRANGLWISRADDSAGVAHDIFNLRNLAAARPSES